MPGAGIITSLFCICQHTARRALLPWRKAFGKALSAQLASWACCTIDRHWIAKTSTNNLWTSCVGFPSGGQAKLQRLGGNGTLTCIWRCRAAVLCSMALMAWLDCCALLPWASSRSCSSETCFWAVSLSLPACLAFDSQDCSRHISSLACLIDLDRSHRSDCLFRQVTFCNPQRAEWQHLQHCLASAATLLCAP